MQASPTWLDLLRKQMRLRKDEARAEQFHIVGVEQLQLDAYDNFDAEWCVWTPTRVYFPCSSCDGGFDQWVDSVPIKPDGSATHVSETANYHREEEITNPG